MNILLTGSNGFLGREIYNVLNSHHNVLTLSRNNAHYQYDLSKSKPKIEEDFELVIHAAGLAHFHPKNISEENQYYLVNVNGTLNLLESLQTSKTIKSFIFISSVAVYGVSSGQNINESHPLDANDPYGKSKKIAEEIVQKWCLDRNIKCTILRLPLVVGKNPKGNLFDLVNSIKRNLYFNIDGGAAKKSMVLANDVANILVKVSKYGGTFNLCDGYNPSFIELTSIISKQMGKRRVYNMNIIFARIIAKIGDLIGSNFPLNTKKLKKITTDLTFDDTLARQTFGWSPKRVIDNLSLDIIR